MQKRKKVGRPRIQGNRYPCGRLRKQKKSRAVRKQAPYINGSPLYVMFKLNIISREHYQAGLCFAEMRHNIFGKTTADTMSYTYDHMLMRGKTKATFFPRDIHDNIPDEYFEDMYNHYKNLLLALKDCGKTIQSAVMDLAIYDKFPTWFVDYFSGKQEFCDETHLVNLKIGFDAIEKYFQKNDHSSYSLLRSAKF